VGSSSAQQYFAINHFYFPVLYAYNTSGQTSAPFGQTMVLGMAPVVLIGSRLQVASVKETFLVYALAFPEDGHAEFDAGEGAGDLAGDEGFAADWAFVVEVTGRRDSVRALWR
jgi:hypothetical protein